MIDLRSHSETTRIEGFGSTGFVAKNALRRAIWVLPSRRRSCSPSSAKPSLAEVKHDLVGAK